MRGKINESEHLDSVEHSSKETFKVSTPSMVLAYIYFHYCVFIIYTAIFIDLEIDLKELISNGSKYLVDVIGRMLPPDFSNFKLLLFSMLETIEIAMMGTLLATILLSIPLAYYCLHEISPWVTQPI